MVDYISKTPTTGLLTGICPTCELLIHRMANVATLTFVCGDVSVAHQSPLQRLIDSQGTFQNVTFAKDSQ